MEKLERLLAQAAVSGCGSAAGKQKEFPGKQDKIEGKDAKNAGTALL